MLLPWAEHPKCLQRSDHGCFTGLSPIAHVADRELLVTNNTLHIRLAAYAMISTLSGW